MAEDQHLTDKFYLKFTFAFVSIDKLYLKLDIQPDFHR